MTIMTGGAAQLGVVGRLSPIIAGGNSMIIPDSLEAYDFRLPEMMVRVHVLYVIPGGKWLSPLPNPPLGG
jgi:hypothetical protein